MFRSLTTRFALPSTAAGVGLLIMPKQIIENDSKRRFYEDDTHVVPVPGTITPTSQEDINALGSTEIINGSSIRTGGGIESLFRASRQFMNKFLDGGIKYVNKASNKYYQTEGSFTSTLSGIHDRNEDLLPNSLYIVVAFLSGNVMTHQRGIVSKAVLPVALGIGSFKYFLPNTFANTKSFFWDLEKKKTPAVARQQELALERSTKLVKSLDDTSKFGKEKAVSSISFLKEKIISFTGLNIDEEVSKK